MDTCVITRTSVKMETCARQTVMLPLLKFGCMFCMDIMKRKYNPYLHKTKTFNCGVEPRCSKYDFEEKVLEKVIRFENKMELLSDSMEKIATKVKSDFDSMKKDLEQQRLNQSDAFNQLAETLRVEWKGIQTDVGLLENKVEEDVSLLNRTIQSQFEGVSAQSQQPPYAFSAYDLSAAKPSDGSILVFTKVHFNDDGLYSTTTGKYTAPVDGLYEFHATLSSCCSSKMSIDVEFQAGDKAIGKFSVVDLTSYDRSSSGSATARLQKDTEVYIRVTATGGNYRFREDAYFMSSFTGYRI